VGYRVVGHRARTAAPAPRTRADGRTEPGARRPGPEQLRDPPGFRARRPARRPRPGHGCGRSAVVGERRVLRGGPAPAESDHEEGRS
jgi:hypothetical protein